MFQRSYEHPHPATSLSLTSIDVNLLVSAVCLPASTIALQRGQHSGNDYREFLPCLYLLADFPPCLLARSPVKTAVNHTANTKLLCYQQYIVLAYCRSYQILVLELLRAHFAYEYV